DETDVDCGGSCAPAKLCGNGGGCFVAADCASGFCGGVKCEPCALDMQCDAGSYCEANVCAPVVANGGTCSKDAACASDHCADGVCCDTACTGVCEACDASP